MEKVLIAIIFLFSMANTTVYALPNPMGLNIPLQESIISLDPTHIQDVPSLFISRQINCQLVRNKGAILSLEAADEIKYISPLAIRIKIKKDALFHDQSSITAEDVIASFSYLKKSQTVTHNIFYWIERLEAVDNKTVIFYLKNSTPQFLTVLSSPNYAIFKKSFLLKAEKNPALWNNPMGCGGYKIESLNSKTIKLSPVSSGMPITFHLLHQNQIDANDIELFDIVSLKVIGKSSKMNKFNKVELFDPLQLFIGLNTQSKFWKNKEQRCAFLAKLNPDYLLKNYGDIATIANDFLPQGSLGYESSADFIGNIRKKEKNDVLLPQPQVFSLAYLTVSIPKMYLASYRQMVQKIYPEINMLPISNTKSFGPEFLRQNGDALLYGIKSNSLDAYEYFQVFFNKDANFSRIYDPELIQKVQDSQEATNANDRVKVYREIVNKIEDICVIRSLITIPMRIIYTNKKLKIPNIGVGPLNEYYLGNITYS